MKRLIYFTADDHCVYAWTRGRLTLEAKFAGDDLGVTAFREYLAEHRGALFYAVADLAGEDFHEELIPYLRGGDRELVVQRRLAQRYRDTRLAAALSLGEVRGERRNERLLLTSFTNTQRLTPWLDALAESEAKLAGMFSVPLLAPALAARLGAARGGRCFVVTANDAGLRQCYVDHGRLRFARLERTADMAPAALAAFVRSETGRLAQYLSTLRVLPREGPPIQVIVVAPPGQRAAFEQTLVSDTRLSFLTVDQSDAVRRAGVKAAPAGMGAEQLYLHLAVRRPPREQFARREDRRSFVLWQVRRGVLAAGALGFAGCALYAGASWLDVVGIRAQVGTVQAETSTAQQEYQRITSAFPVTQTTTDNLRATVVEFTNIARRTAAPERSLVHLSKVLEDFPLIEIDSLLWRVDATGERGGRVSGAAPASAAAGTAAADTNRAPTEILEISGRVGTMRRSDYRALTAEVQRFADALRADPAYEVQRTQLPFDVTSEGTLSGDIGAGTDTGEAPRFTIVLARSLR
ncbi:MAG: hypothetical protein ABI423_02500 [Burkholderiales bacterium]